jgi:hypothetical protein
MPPTLMAVVNTLETLDVMQADFNLRVIQAQNDIPVSSVVGVKS